MATRAVKVLPENTDDNGDPIEVPTSPEAEALIADGARPVEPDVAAMLKQIQQLQGHVDALREAQGIPSDPVEAAVKNLLAHVEARKAANPGIDFTEVEEALKKLEDTPQAKHTDLVRTVVTKFHRRTGHAEFGYLPELADNLHEAVLKAS